MDKNLAARAGRWSAQHRKRAIGGWILFVLLATVIGGAVGQRTLADEDMGNGESRRADQAIADAGFPEETGEQVLVQVKRGRIGESPRFTAAVGDVVERLEATPHVKEVESPYARGNEGQRSRDGRSALVTFKLAGEDDLATDRVDATLAATRAAQRAHPDLRIEQFGDASADKALSAAFEDDFKKAEYLSLPITLIILIVAFGALVAAGLPLMLALTAVMGTIGLLGPVSQLVALDEAISSVVLLVGLAVGVDYCMFYVRREMEERDAGKGPEAALEAAAATSGRAVLISGITVIVAMAGMFLAGSPVFLSFGIASRPLSAGWMDRAGSAMTTSTAVAAIVEITGWRRTGLRMAPQKREPSCPASARAASRRARPLRNGMWVRCTRSPSHASIAGRTVRDPMTATPTTIMEPIANDMNVSLPERNMPAMAPMTVRPEISTARPEVAAAASRAAPSERPARRSSRSRRM